MTTGNRSTGVVNPYYSHTRKTWAGSDDPVHKSVWNAYTVSATSHIHSNPAGKYPMGVGSAPLSASADDELRLIDKLVSAARAHEFHAGVFLGQAHEVAQSVESTARAFIGIKKALLRGDLTGATRFLARAVSGADKREAQRRLNYRDLAGTHLALVYGWVPLLSDVYAASKALEVLANPPRRSSITVSRGGHDLVEGSQSPTLYTCPINRSFSTRITYEFVEEMSAVRSLGILDPASVLWELGPYTSVADWFVPIGTYLDALSVIPFLKGSFKRQNRQKLYGLCSDLGTSGDFTGSQAQFIETHYTRLAESSSISVPLPRFRGFGQLFNSAQRTSNAIALIANAYKKSWFLEKIR